MSLAGTEPVYLTPLSSGVASMSLQDSLGCIVRESGEVKCTESETFEGKLTAVRGMSSVVVAVATNLDRMCALSETHAVKCWQWGGAPTDVVGF